MKKILTALAATLLATGTAVAADCCGPDAECCKPGADCCDEATKADAPEQHAAAEHAIR